MVAGDRAVIDGERAEVQDSAGACRADAGDVVGDRAVVDLTAALVKDRAGRRGTGRLPPGDDEVFQDDGSRAILEEDRHAGGSAEEGAAAAAVESNPSAAVNRCLIRRYQGRCQ